MNQKTKSRILAAFVGMAGLSVCQNAAAQMYDDPRMFSFEKQTELQFISANKSAVELSGTHFKNGNKSLQWTYEPGASLHIKKDLQFEPKIQGGRDNYLSAFIVWIYNETPAPGKQIQVNFLKDGKQCTTFPININFKGWRGVWV